MATTKIEFVSELPPRTSINSDSARIAEALRARPGDWAKVITGAKTAGPASTINTGGNSSYAPKGTFEATSRQTGKGAYDIYARFVKK